MVFRNRSAKYSRMSRRYTNQGRQGGTGASYSGSVGLIRHSHNNTFELDSGKVVCYPMIAYNPSNQSTPLVVDGSSTKVRYNWILSEGSRCDWIRTNITIRQDDTSKNNTVYVGAIATSFNEGQLSEALMETNFMDLISSDANGEMTASGTPQDLSVIEYTSKDILQHNVKNLLTPQFQLYSGRVISLNQNVRVPAKCRRSQNGMFFGLVFMNDSGTSDSSVHIRMDINFKEIPATIA